MTPGLFDPHFRPYRWEEHVPSPGRWRSDVGLTLLFLAMLAPLAPGERRLEGGHAAAAAFAEEVAGGPEGTAGWMPLPLVSLGPALQPAQFGRTAGALRPEVGVDCGRA